MDVVSQIGLGYTFLFLLWGKPRLWQGIAAAVILVGYWALFAAYPLPPEDFDYASVGVSADWQHLEGFSRHWDKGTNPAARFDTWFLNLFPRAKPFAYESSGYPTLNFIPSLATMIFGLMAGEYLRGPQRRWVKFLTLAGIGVAALGIGWGLELAGICPVVKIIWTPSWAIFSTGWTLLMLAGFYGVIDVLGLRRWSFPLLVVGMNSILIYVMESMLSGWFSTRLKIHFGQDLYPRVANALHLGEAYVPIVEHVLVLVAMWLVCYWLYRQKIFVRI
jgi:predicted acyltransferase